MILPHLIFKLELLTMPGGNPLSCAGICLPCLPGTVITDGHDPPSKHTDIGVSLGPQACAVSSCLPSHLPSSRETPKSSILLLASEPGTWGCGAVSRVGKQFRVPGGGPPYPERHCSFSKEASCSDVLCFPLKLPPAGCQAALNSQLFLPPREHLL